MSRYAAAHSWANLAGPGDARPTAQQIVQDSGVKKALNGKVILITGVSSGVGAESAIALAATGATIIGAGRSIPKARAALSSIAEYPHLHFLELDLASRASVDKFAMEFLRQFNSTINILMNNAGAIFAEYSLTEDGFERQFAINYLGQFQLFSLLKDALLSSATSDFPSRVVNLSSIGHRGGAIQLDNIHVKKEEYDPFTAYSQAKTASIYMATEIERRYGAKNLHAWSVHPGAVLTSFLDNSGLERGVVDNLMQASPQQIFKSKEQGAATQVWAAISPDVLAKEALGKYVEDVSVSKPKDETDNPEFFGYADHIYDEEKAMRLWKISEQLLDVQG